MASSVATASSSSSTSAFMATISLLSRSASVASQTAKAFARSATRFFVFSPATESEYGYPFSTIAFSSRVVLSSVSSPDANVASTSSVVSTRTLGRRRDTVAPLSSSAGDSGAVRKKALAGSWGSSDADASLLFPGCCWTSSETWLRDLRPVASHKAAAKSPLLEEPLQNDDEDKLEELLVVFVVVVEAEKAGIVADIDILEEDAETPSPKKVPFIFVRVGMTGEDASPPPVRVLAVPTQIEGCTEGATRLKAPPFCTTLRSNPTMRDRKSAFAASRLASAALYPS
mmetsp:Transcript_17765/g.44417  ORF Transcript_17765/g.44417 Transcript_17765/m.44417 type:complete len:286 (+) Transcript_17765:579-1436(+)